MMGFIAAIAAAIALVMMGTAAGYIVQRPDAYGIFSVMVAVAWVQEDRGNRPKTVLCAAAVCLALGFFLRAPFLPTVRFLDALFLTFGIGLLGAAARYLVE